MSRFDMIGYIASGLVLGAFSMKNMLQLRIVAIASNIAFIGYGLGLDLMPVVALHVALLPMNSWRLWQVLQDLSGSNTCPSYPMKLPTEFPGKLAAVIGFLVITTALGGWMIVTQVESSAAVPGLSSYDVKRPNSPTAPTLIAWW